MNRFSMRRIVPLIVLAQASACAADPAPAPLVQTPAPACAQAQSLFGVLGKKDIFSATPEAFLQSTRGLLQVAADNTSTPAPGMAMRKIEFTPEQAWLDSGELNYDLVEGKAVLDGATFVFRSACFSAPAQLLALGAQHLGGDFKENQTAPPDVVTNRYWQWPDADINYIHFMDLYAGKDFYHLKVERDPAPQEGD